MLLLGWVRGQRIESHLHVCLHVIAALVPKELLYA